MHKNIKYEISSTQRHRMKSKNCIHITTRGTLATDLVPQNLAASVEHAVNASSRTS